MITLVFGDSDPGDLENPDDDKQVPVAPRDSDRVYVDDTLIYTTPPASPVAATDAPAKIQPGDQLLIEVLKAASGAANQWLVYGSS